MKSHGKQWKRKRDRFEVDYNVEEVLLYYSEEHAPLLRTVTQAIENLNADRATGEDLSTYYIQRVYPNGVKGKKNAGIWLMEEQEALEWKRDMIGSEFRKGRRRL